MEASLSLNYRKRLKVNRSKDLHSQSTVPGNLLKELPWIQVNNRHPRDVSADVSAALSLANNPPYFFTMGGNIVRIRRDENGGARTEIINADIMRGRIDRVANLYIKGRDGKGVKPATPSLHLIQDLISGNEPDRFPPLKGVTQCPIVRADGTIVTQPGYDTETHMYYNPTRDLSNVIVPEHPTGEEVNHALSVLLEPLCDFAFVSDSDRENALALLLTPFVRSSIDGCVPIALIDSTKQGSGKGLLTSVISLIATGELPHMSTMPCGEAEWRKLITSLILTGSSINVLDNVDGVIDSSAFASILTSLRHRDRILGHSEIVDLPHTAIWIANGNNIRLGRDIPRRSFIIRMDAKSSTPWLRKEFKHPDLVQYVKKERTHLVQAALIVIRAWYCANCPSSNPPIMGGFDVWARTMHGILSNVGMKDFLANSNELLENTDIDGPQWEAFILACNEIFGDRPVTSSDVYELSRTDNMADILPTTLFDGIEKGGQNEHTMKRAIGQKFRSLLGTRFGNSNARIERAKDCSHRKIAKWIFMCG